MFPKANSMKEMGPSVRPPVQVFNAGMCQAKSYEDELLELPQPTLILQGDADPRDRNEFKKYVKECEIMTLPGRNALPWESPKETSTAIRDFIATHS